MTLACYGALEIVGVIIIIIIIIIIIAKYEIPRIFSDQAQQYCHNWKTAIEMYWGKWNDSSFAR